MDGFAFVRPDWLYFYDLFATKRPEFDQIWHLESPAASVGQVGGLARLIVVLKLPAHWRLSTPAGNKGRARFRGAISRASRAVPQHTCRVAGRMPE
jgi:hypothetical protein